MFQAQTQKTGAFSYIALFDLIYHSTVRHVRKDHGNALMGLIMNILQTVLFVGAFYLMFSVLQMRSADLTPGRGKSATTSSPA